MVKRANSASSSGGVPVGLLVCSHGGTSMDQWSPAKKNQGGRSLYGSMARRIAAVGGKVAGCLWYQGESDTVVEAAPIYRKKLRSFIETLRRDLASPDLPFLLVQLGVFFGDASVLLEWDRVREDQRLIEVDLPNVAMTPALGLGVDDVIHINTAGMRMLGRRLAHLAEMLHLRNRELKVGPRPKSARFTDRDRTRLRVRFAETNGGLARCDRVFGFSLEATGPDESGLLITSCKVDREQPTDVLLSLAEPAPRSVSLWYGRGLNPTVNLKDRWGMPCPAFGPLQVQPARHTPNVL